MAARHANLSASGPAHMSTIKILVIPGSLRIGSINVKLAKAAVDEFARADIEVSLLSLGDYPLPTATLKINPACRCMRSISSA
jgi:NAD(P)H-dependent FMN reductase